jgi:hypothetical protein
MLIFERVKQIPFGELNGAITGVALWQYLCLNHLHECASCTFSQKNRSIAGEYGYLDGIGKTI